MSTEKISFNKSRKLLSQQLLLKVSLFRFHFVPALQYLVCCCNEYPVKQTASFYPRSPLKPVFFVSFFL